MDRTADRWDFRLTSENRIAVSRFPFLLIRKKRLVFSSSNDHISFISFNMIYIFHAHPACHLPRNLKDKTRADLLHTTADIIANWLFFNILYFHIFRNIVIFLLASIIWSWEEKKHNCFSGVEKKSITATQFSEIDRNTLYASFE